MNRYRCIYIVACAAVLLCATAPAESLPVDGAPAAGLCSLAIIDGAGSAYVRFGAETAAARGQGTDAYIGAVISRSLEYFFTGLCIPDDKFWVNLTPEGRAQVIDPLLGSTDLGKIMLAADLTLKKDASEMTNPRTSGIGRQYWDKLYGKAAELGIEDMPIAHRVWITPGDVVLAQDTTGVRIVKSALKVCLESDRLSAASTTSNEKQRALQKYAADLMHELIVPALDAKVNGSPAYEQLRQAYRAIILARWYRQRSGRDVQELMRQIRRTMPAGLSGNVPYTEEQIYREYMASLQQGDYNFSENTAGRLQAYMELITRRYFSGGVALQVIAAITRHVNGDDDNAGNKNPPFSFDVVIDSKQEDPVRYAIEHASAVSRGIGTANEKPAMPADNLPPISTAGLDRQLKQEQDRAIIRVMIRNL